MNNVHRKKDNSYKCDKCNELFSKKSNYQRHIDGSINEDGSSKNACEICLDQFCTKRKLLKHSQAHTTYECKHCQKSFAKKQSLELHMACREEKSCPECAEVLCNMFDFNAHCHSHKYATCSKCGNDYFKSSLADHILMKHVHESVKET